MQALAFSGPSSRTEVASRDIELETRSQQHRPTEWVEVRVLIGIDFAREELEYEYVMVDRQLCR